MASNSSHYSCSTVSADAETRITWSVAFVVIGFVIAVVNFVTVLTFTMNRHLRRRGVYCLINLAIVDMLLGVSYSAYESLVLVVYLSRIRVNKIVWILVLSPASHMAVLSILSLVLVSLDRVYATFFPFRHRTTRPRVYTVVFTITWLLPLPLVITEDSISAILSVDCMYFFIVIMLYLVCLTIICTSYTAIFIQVKIQARRLQPNPQPTATIQVRQKREQHLAMTLFIVTMLSVMTWLPYIVAYSIGLLQNKSYKTFISFGVTQSVVLMQFINSLINPIICVIRMKDFRYTLSRLIFKCSRHQQPVHPVDPHGNNRREQQPAMELQPCQPLELLNR